MITISEEAFRNCLDISEFMWERGRLIPKASLMFNDALEMYMAIQNGCVEQYVEALSEELNNSYDYYEKLEIDGYIYFIESNKGKINQYTEE